MFTLSSSKYIHTYIHTYYNVFMSGDLTGLCLFMQKKFYRIDHGSLNLSCSSHNLQGKVKVSYEDYETKRRGKDNFEELSYKTWNFVLTAWQVSKKKFLVGVKLQKLLLKWSLSLIMQSMFMFIIKYFVSFPLTKSKF